MNRPAPLLARCLPALADRRADGELIAAFLHDGDEAAFAELLRRHGPLVWSACRRLLPDPADAEDAFQTAFLVLVRQARRLTAEAAVGPWLYRVAVWTARNARRRNARTLARRSVLPDAVADPSPGIESAELRLDLDAALLTLPEKYRAALVLCHLQGWSRREAADRLGCPEGTLSSLLSRGLTRLRAKLAGHDPFPLLAVPVLSVPAALSSATARAACAARFSAALFPVTVSHLAEGVLRMFWVKKATAATMALVAVFAFGIGVGMNAQYGSRSAAQDTAKPDSSKSLPAPVLDYDKAIAKIRSDIGGWEATVGTVGPQADVFQKQLEQLLKDTPGDTKAIASLREAVPKFRETVANVEKRIREAQAQIKTLEAAKRAAQSPNRTKADADLEAEAARIILAQLRADRDQLQGQSLHHTRQSEDFKQKAADSDAKARQVADLIQQLETRRSDTAPVAKGAGLEVTIIDEKGLWPFTVKEYDAKTGKLIGTLICDTADILTVTLSRVMKDPAGPRDLKITVQANTPYERVRAVLEACHKAGFKEAKVSGPLPIRKLGEPVREYLVDEVTIPNLRFEYTERKEPINIDDLLKMFQPKK